MSYDEKNNKMDWKDECIWIGISVVSGVLLSLLFMYSNKFPELNLVSNISVCCIAFYVLSILIRVQNHRGKVLSGKTVVNEKLLKFIFPILGIGVGIALIIF